MNFINFNWNKIKFMKFKKWQTFCFMRGNNDNSNTSQTPELQNVAVKVLSQLASYFSWVV